MSAEVTMRSGDRKWLAWCESCADGIGVKSRKKAQEWADKHNHKHHPEPMAKEGGT